MVCVNANFLSTVILKDDVVALVMLGVYPRMSAVKGGIADRNVFHGR